LPAAVLHLQFGADDVEVRYFAAFFKLSGQLEKLLAFRGASLRNLQLALCRRNTEIILHDRYHQTPRGNLRARPCDGGSGSGASIVRYSSEVNRFMHVPLADVFVHRIVGNIPNAAGAGPLCVEHLVVVDGRWQQGIARLFSVFCRDGGVRGRRLKFHAVLPCASESIVERQPQTRCSIIRGLRGSRLRVGLGHLRRRSIRLLARAWQSEDPKRG